MLVQRNDLFGACRRVVGEKVGQAQRRRRDGGALRQRGAEFADRRCGLGLLLEELAHQEMRRRRMVRPFEQPFETKLRGGRLVVDGGQPVVAQLPVAAMRPARAAPIVRDRQFVPAFAVGCFQLRHAGADPVDLVLARELAEQDERVHGQVVAPEREHREPPAGRGLR